jgi:serine O-acetyltransferase
VEETAILDVRSDRAFEETLGFLRSCLSGGVLDRYRGLFESSRLERDPVFREAVEESLEAFLPDLTRWGRQFQEPRDLFDHLVLAPNLSVVFFYRLTHALFTRGVEKLPDVLAAAARQMTGVEIYYSARCGPGLKIIHGLGTVIGAQCRIGSHFTAYHGVTVGDRISGPTGLENRPTIGDYVIACAGVSIFGPVRIGDHTLIAAHSVVLDSLPPRCVAAGAPARVRVEGLSDEKFAEYWAAFRG